MMMRMCLRYGNAQNVTLWIIKLSTTKSIFWIIPIALFKKGGDRDELD